MSRFRRIYGGLAAIGLLALVVVGSFAATGSAQAHARTTGDVAFAACIICGGATQDQ